MEGTLNYGYETQISAVSAIDRDLRRIEDKANQVYENVIRHEEILKSLSKHKCSGYSKCEIDTLLHEKVDKKDGYSLISQDCLQEICSNKKGVALLGEYIQELQERNFELESQLANKADAAYTTLHEFTSFSDGIMPATGWANVYSIDQFGRVNLSFTAKHIDEPFNTGTVVIGKLPAGFRPTHLIPIFCNYWTNQDLSYGIFGQIDPGGNITVFIPSSQRLYTCASTVTFRASRN